MRVAKVEAERLQERFKDAGKKTEDALGEAGKVFGEAWSGLKTLRTPGWFGGGGDGQRSPAGSLDRAPLASYIAGPANVPPPVPVPGHPTPITGPGEVRYPPLQQPQLVPQQAESPHKVAVPSKATPAPPAARDSSGTGTRVMSLPPTPLASAGNDEDDMAMRHHFAALERLVAMGLSPQAARAALRNMDEWLTSNVGIAEMARAEATARESGEHILHMGDHVRLEGLLKNAAANGKMAVLQQFVAESHRWKVSLTDGKSYLLQAKFLQPVAQRPTSYLQQLEEVDATASNPPQQSSGRDPSSSHTASVAQTQALERERAEDDAVRQLQEDEMRRQQEEMRLKAEEIAKAEEMLDAERMEMRRSRASLAMVQAHVASMLEKSEVGGEPKEHRMDDSDGAEEWDNTQDDDENDADSARDGSEGEGSNDELWDMDWSSFRHDAERPETEGYEEEHNFEDDAANRPNEEAAGETASAEASRREASEAASVPTSIDREAAEVLIADSSLAEVSAAEVSTAEMSAAEVSTPEVSAAEVATAEVSAAEVATAEVSAAEMSTAEVSAAEVSTTEVSTAVLTAEVQIAEVSSTLSIEMHNEARPEGSLDASAREMQIPEEKPTASPEEVAELQHTLEETRRLAEQPHNGEDITEACRSNHEKEAVPGAHRALAAKLEERRRQVDAEQLQHAEDEAF